jgi:hypothetical protein
MCCMSRLEMLALLLWNCAYRIHIKCIVQWRKNKSPKRPFSLKHFRLAVVFTSSGQPSLILYYTANCAVSWSWMFTSGRLTQQYITTAAVGCHWTGRRIPECLTVHRVRFSDVVWMSPSPFCDVTRHRLIDVSGHWALRPCAMLLGTDSSTFRDTIGPIFEGSNSHSSWTALNTLTVALLFVLFGSRNGLMCCDILLISSGLQHCPHFATLV